MRPETRYAFSSGANIAYQVLGTGPHDLVFVLGWVSNIEDVWEEAAFARFLTGLSSFSRLILFDKRGTGLSDRVTEMPSLEVRMDDVRAVMDTAGSERAALFGLSEGGPMCALFSATYPNRTSAHNVPNIDFAIHPKLDCLCGPTSIPGKSKGGTGTLVVSRFMPRRA